MRRMVYALVLLDALRSGRCGAAAAAAQRLAQAPPLKPPATIRVGDRVVVEEVTVKDKSGKPIEGLTANDFILTEDGVPQTISFVEFQQLQAAAQSGGASRHHRVRLSSTCCRPPRECRLRPSSRATRATATTACWLCTSICPPCSLPISCERSTPR